MKLPLILRLVEDYIKHLNEDEAQKKDEAKKKKKKKKREDEDAAGGMCIRNVATESLSDIADQEARDAGAALMRCQT